MPELNNDIEAIKGLSNESEVQNRLFEKGIAVKELISSRPGFLIRWGVTIFLFILILITVATWFIQYPDIVEAKAKLTSINVPKPIISKLDAQLKKLFVKEGDIVRKGQIIAYMESTADADAIIYLSDQLDSFHVLLLNNKIDSLSFPIPEAEEKNAILGELQGHYELFIQSLVLYKNYLSKGFFLHKKKMLLKDMVNLQRLNNNLHQQKQLHEQDLILAEQTFSSNEKLKNDSIISAFDYRIESSKLLGKKITLPQVMALIISNEDQQNEKRKEILELENQISQQKIIFIQSLNTFQSEVDEWKKKYLLISPITGRIIFSGFVQEDQQVRSNQVVCFINPGNTQYYAEMYISQFNFGKVKTGQKVLLKFPSYPYREYGSVVGELEFISGIPTDSGYLAKVKLVNGLTTNYQKSIQFWDGLLANGEIITENRRLLEKLYYNMIPSRD